MSYGIYLVGDNLLVFQSRDFEKNTSVRRFLLKIKDDLTYEGFFCGVKYTKYTALYQENELKRVETMSTKLKMFDVEI